MAIQEIKSKINDNKHEKERKLLNTALRLFTEKGIKKTSIQDIVHDAGIHDEFIFGYGTYLYLLADSPDGKFTKQEEKEVVKILSSFRHE